MFLNLLRALRNCFLVAAVRTRQEAILRLAPLVHEREDDALDHQLPNETPAACPERAEGVEGEGTMGEAPEAMVLVETAFGGRRVMDQLVGDPLPRIC